jgi:hypothetical protein
MKKIFTLLLLCYLILSIQGCLTVETKEYSFKLTKDNSGEGTIRFINIMTDKDTLDAVQTDYQTLIDSYINGDALNQDLPNAQIISKKLYEEDDQLCGEVKFKFDDIKKLKFYKYKDTGPWCYHFSTFDLMGGSESYFSSNGTYGGQDMPVIFWDGTQKEFKFKTTVTAPGKKTKSLLEIWQEKGEK